MKKSSKVFFGGLGCFFVLIFILATPFRTLYAGQKVMGNDKVVTKTETVAPFENVNIKGNFEVTITPGKPQVAITADENIVPYIEIGVSQNALNMGMQPGVTIFSSNPQKAVV